MPLLSQTTIDQVRALPIVDVVGRHVKLNERAGQSKACCPFHTENSPSFTLRPRHGTFRCFGCDAAGDGIGFIQRLKKLDFRTAVEELAKEHSIALEFEDETPEAAKQREERQTKRKALQDVLDYAAAYYAGVDVPEEWRRSRGFSADVLAYLGVGYADGGVDSFKVAAEKLFTTEALLNAGLIKSVGGHYEDTFQDRVVFPIRADRGHVVAFSARRATDPPKGTKETAPKYLNSSESVYKKAENLFGIDRALRAIQTAGFVYLVEGQPNVARFHEVARATDAERGAHQAPANVVASCGTALTEQQVALLKKYTTTVVIVPDHDLPKGGKPSAGLVALHRSARLFLAAGFTVKVLLPDEGKDPDEQLVRATVDDAATWFRSTRDYLAALVDEAEAKGEADPAERAAQIERVRETLELIQNDTVRQCYYDEAGKTWRAFAKSPYKFKKRKDTLDLAITDRLESAQKADAFDYKFYEAGGCYLNGKGERINNFTMQVLFFVRSETAPRYVVALKNMFGTTRTTAISTDDFTTIGTLKKIIARQGAFFWEGDELSLINVKMKLFQNVPEATTPQTMGWNAAGFYTWANGLLHDGEFVKPDRTGVVKLHRPLRSLDDFRRIRVQSAVLLGSQQVMVDDAEEALERIGEANIVAAIAAGQAALVSYHFLPFASNLKAAEDDDDGWENERRYRHTGTGELGFQHWASLVHRGFFGNGMVMVAYLCAALFRDVIFDANGRYFPLLNLFGPRGTGKSKAAESLAAMFGEYPSDGVNVSSGTTAVGISRYMSAVANGLYWFNEFKNQTTDKKTIETLKGIADGSGRMMGRATGGNETRTVKPKSAAMLGGQDMPTIDVALLSRCIVLEFTQALFGQNDRDAYAELDVWHTKKEFTAVTCEILRHRGVIADGYRAAIPATKQRIRAAFRAKLSADDLPNEDRLLNNLTTLLAPVQLLATVLDFPFTVEQLLDQLVERVRFQVGVLKSGDDVGAYFSVLMTMVGRDLMSGTHYKIQKESDGVTKLFLRFRAVHGLYQQAAARMGVIALGEAVLKSYLHQHPFFLEERKRGVHIGTDYPETSAMVLNYDLMREQDIEFNPGTYTAAAEGLDDASRELTRKVHLNGNAPDLIRAFVEALAPADTPRPLTRLLADFNADKEPAMMLPAFVEALKAYLDRENRARDLTFNAAFDAVRVSELVPF